TAGSLTMPWEKFKTAPGSSTIVACCASLAWTWALLAAARSVDFNEPYLPFAVAGAFTFYVRGKPSRWEIYIWLGLTAPFLGMVHPPQIRFWVLRVACGLSMLGLSALLLLGWRILWSAGDDRKIARSLLVPALVLIAFVAATAWGLRWTGPLNPRTDDLWIYVFDGSLGLQPSFAIGKVMYRSLVLTRITLLTYLSLPFVMALVCAWSIPPRPTRIHWRMLGVLLLAGAAGGLLYNVLPATGPLYAFGRDFPWHSTPYSALGEISLQKMSLPVGIPRNGMPSLHVAWVILLCWNSRRLPRWLRVSMIVYALLTVVATLGSGQHYVMDLVVSVPFALFVQAAAAWTCVSRAVRARAVSAGITLTFFWLVLLRFGTREMLVSPVLPWTLVLASTVGSFWLESSGEKQNAPASLAITSDSSTSADSSAPATLAGSPGTSVDSGQRSAAKARATAHI
ncbi:MAG TPA: phosphatase PAP2 family protein, partial [Terriglobia bacterium]|nr:phosphatase PAP2 family protein [Terriglobia bacterium]